PKGLRRALAPFVRTLDKTSRGSSRPGPRLRARRCRVHHPDPRSLRRTIAPLPGPGWRIDTAIPNLGKVEYFCERGLTGFCGRWVFCPTGQIGMTDVSLRRPWRALL